MSRYLALVEPAVGETVDNPGALARVADDGSAVELLVGPETWVSEPGLIRYVVNGEPGAASIDETAALALAASFPWPGLREQIAKAARAGSVFHPARIAYSDDQARDESGKWTDDGGSGGGGEAESTGEPRRNADGVPLDEKGNVDVDRYVEENPRRDGEDVFVWQGRIVEGLDRETQSEVLFETREQYDRVEELWDGAQRWNEENGLGPIPANVGELRADLDEADAVARYMETATDQSASPLVHAAYDDFKRQNEAMYDYMTRPKDQGGLGVRVEFTNEVDPYPSAEAQAQDLRENGRIIIESGLGGDHSSLSVDEYDRFRAVHDVFGHAAIGGGFDRHGEYQAWVAHAAMYTGPGRQAMSTEYHGVNSALWAGEGGTPGTGMSVLLPESYGDPPWSRETPIVAAVASSGQQRTAKEIVAKLALDPEFARQFSHVEWHTRGGNPANPTPEAFLAGGEYIQGEDGRFEGSRPTSGGSSSGRGDTAAGEKRPGAASRSVVDRVRAQGGITVEPLTGNEPTDGYVVAKSLEATRIIPEGEFFNDRDQGVDAIASYLRDNAADFDDDGAMLGIWHDVEHAEVVFDVVENVTDRDEAIQRGRDRDQQAVWDVAGNVEIETGGSGGRQAAADQGGEATEADIGDDRGRAARVRGDGVRPGGAQGVTSARLAYSPDQPRDAGRFAEVEGDSRSGESPVVDMTAPTLQGAARGWVFGKTQSPSMRGASALRESYKAGPPYDEEVQALVDAIDAAGPTTETTYRGTAFAGDPEAVAAQFQPGETVSFPLASFSSDERQAEKFGQWTRNDSLGQQSSTEVLFVAPPGSRGLPIDYEAISFDNANTDTYFRDEKETVIAGDYRVAAVETYTKTDYYEEGADPRLAVRVTLEPT